MLFNSYIFWLFFIAVAAVYWRLGHRMQNRFLLLASYVFYAAWNWRFLSLIWISTGVDYVAARGIGGSDSPRRRKALLAMSVCTNLTLLGVFKYFNFFAHDLAGLLSAMGMGVSTPTLNVVLPVGISFYTFQTMSYTIDVYRGLVRPARSLGDFALFVCFFPQLVAGPIERHNRLMPQITSPRRWQGEYFAEGLYHILMGLFKKIVVADNLGVIVNAVFTADPHTLSGTEVLFGTYAFAFQIYGDFSGYSSIAKGVAKWLGFDLMDNFRMPYLAVSPSDFWRRWHISLSSWLRDYLYIPLGGNRHGRVATYRNLMLTMLLGGLWHGAGWTFIAWGGFHGLVLCVYRLAGAILPARPADRQGSRWRRAVGMFVMFHLVCLGWLLFRAESITQVWAMLAQVFTNFRLTDLSLYILVSAAFYAGPLMLYEYWVERGGDLTRILARPWAARAALYSYLVLMMWYFPPEAARAFIYFQF